MIIAANVHDAPSNSGRGQNPITGRKPPNRIAVSRVQGVEVPVRTSHIYYRQYLVSGYLYLGNGGRVLVNDRFDVALAADADGVHLKSRGVAPREVRAAASQRRTRPFTVGVATHDAEELAAAATDPAVDYCTVGPVHVSPGKEPLGVSGLRQLLEEARRLVGGSLRPTWLALGGLEPRHVADLAGLARGGERWGVAAVRAFQQAAGHEGGDPTEHAAKRFVEQLGRRRDHRT